VVRYLIDKEYNKTKKENKLVSKDEKVD
jgi:hypothetical protein